MTKEEERKINLICRMAGNMMDEDQCPRWEAVRLAFEIYDEVSSRVHAEHIQMNFGSDINSQS